MKTALLLLLFALEFTAAAGSIRLSGHVSVSGKTVMTVGSPVATDAFQNFSTGTPDALLTEAVLSNSGLGHSGWSRSGGDPFHSFTVVTNVAYTFQTPRLVNGSIVTGTGTKWITVYHANENANEMILFDLPGAQGAFDNCLVEGFIMFGARNDSGTINNLDLWMIDGNPFGYLQARFSASTRDCFAHAGGGNGVALTTALDATYFVQLFYEAAEARVTVRLYHPTTFALLGTSIGTLSGVFDFLDHVSFRANYLDLGDLYGETRFGGLCITYNISALREP